MKSIWGKGASGGTAEGVLRFFRAPGTAETSCGAGIEKERERLEEACGAVEEMLLRFAEKAREDGLGCEAAALFETHALMLRDMELREDMERRLCESGCSAEAAAAGALERQAELFRQLHDDYMKTRAQDICEIRDHLLAALSGSSDSVGVFCKEDHILAAQNFTAADILRMDRTAVKGLLCAGGSPHSHGAVLARLKGLPMVTGVGEELFSLEEGRRVFMDGGSGEILSGALPAARSCAADRGAATEEERKYPAQTKDGHRITILANISGTDEISAAEECGAEGIGLYRTEFLYLQRRDYPDEEVQFAAYRTAAQAFAGRKVVIRTADLGGDKSAEYLCLPKEENPALGMRGIRLSLARPEMLRTQLRAVYRAAVYGDLALMFPMVSSEWEVDRAREFCRSVQRELLEEKIPFREDVPLGIMLETPAAVLMADRLAEKADFFSVGTNDLTQYMLALDRGAGAEEHYDARHPAVLRAVRLAVEAAHRAGIRIGICGDMAADTELCETFLAMGVDELSVPWNMAAKIKREICRIESVEKGGSVL